MNEHSIHPLDIIVLIGLIAGIALLMALGAVEMKIERERALLPITEIAKAYNCGVDIYEYVHLANSAELAMLEKERKRLDTLGECHATSSEANAAYQAAMQPIRLLRDYH